MSMDEKKQLFEFNRERRKILNQLNELGGRGDAGSKAIKKQKEELVNDFKNIDEKRNELLTREERNNQEKFKDSFDPALAAYNKGLNSFYNDVVQVQQGLNGNKFMRVTNDMSVEDLMNTYEIDKSTAQQLVDTRDQTEVDENGQTQKSRINATFVGNDIVVFEDNIDDNLRRSDNKLGAKFAAVSPMHELLHLQNRNAGIVKDGRVVGDFKQAVKEAEVQLKEKLETGKITQEEYDGFINRKALYTLSDDQIIVQHLDHSHQV